VSVGSDTDKPKQRATRPGKTPTAPALERLANRLSDIFETKVKVELGRHKGKIVVEFASMDDLDRIIDAMTTSAAAEEGE
jgi:ParB family transcriptional regulator, chromosome partitioning protein